MNALGSIAWKRWWDAGLSFFYPEVCQICEQERASPAEGYVGARCWQQVRFICPPFCGRCGLPFEGDITQDFTCSNCLDMDLHFQSARSAVVAHGMVLDIIHRYKYQRALWFEPFLADLLTRQAAACLSPLDWDVIVPVPLHSQKLREREFNQAERLAGALNLKTSIPLQNHLIERRLPTATQTHLGRSERAANMRNAFRARPDLCLKGKRIVLVDDVFTTGATTNACARVLRAAGAEKIQVWTVARGL